MAVNHVAITDPNLHEPKGAAAASAKEVYTSDGAGSGTWQKVENQSLEGITTTPGAGFFVVCDGAGGFDAIPYVHGSIYFTNFGAPYTLAETTSYQKVAATTIASGDNLLITEATTSRLTYVGTPDIHLSVIFLASMDQASGADKDAYIALYKNGTLIPGSENVITTVTGTKHTVTCHKDVHASTNDYFEVYSKTSANATVNYYTFNLMATISGVD